MTGLIQDVRYALRQLRKNPGFAIVVLLTLGLGIGANTAIFSLLDTLLFKSMPVSDPSKIVALKRISPDGESESFTYPQFQQFSEAGGTFSHVFGFTYRTVQVRVAGKEEDAAAQLVTGQYFPALGVSSALGRTLSSADERVSDSQPAVVLSYRYWQQRFGSDPSIAGKSLTLGGISVTVVGVMRPEFHGTSLDYSTDLWLPITMQPRVDGGASQLTSTGINWVVVMARLEPTISPDRASTAVNLVFQRHLRSANADSRLLNQRIQIEVGGRPVSKMRGAISTPLMILMGIVGLVLLLACTNIANLMLARGAARYRETAVRIAVGAARGRLIQQFLTETLLLALLGGGVGMGFAYEGENLLLRFIARAANQSAAAEQLQFHIDFRLLSFAAVISLVAGLLFGLVPALRNTRANLVSDLKSSSGCGMSPRLRLNKMLLALQVAICLPLLVAAGLFIHSFQKLASVDLGFDPDNVVQIKSLVLNASYTPAQFDQAWKEILEKIQATPGVLSASSSLPGLFSHSTYQTIAFVGDEQVRVNTLAVTPQYFLTLRIPLLRGRDFSSADSAEMPPVAIVNEALARRLSSNSDPVGNRLRSGIGPKPVEIIGVAKDTKYDSVLAEAIPTVYVPLTQKNLTPSFRVFEIRTSGAPSDAILTLQHIVATVAPTFPVEVRPLRDSIGESLLMQHLIARVTGFFGFLALLLACIGLYGLMSYLVTQKTTEIGIRIAMGASRPQVLRFALEETGVLVLAGCAVGLVASIAASRLVSSELFGLTRIDPTSFVLSTALMLSVALIAGYVPARRATKVDPMVALRYE
jgi:predicted permease